MKKMFLLFALLFLQQSFSTEIWPPRWSKYDPLFDPCNDPFGYPYGDPYNSYDCDYFNKQTAPTSTSSEKLPEKLPEQKKLSAKGMTWSVKTWPIQQNNWAASVGCSGCDAYNGDTLCTQSLPLLCVIDYKKTTRPFYIFEKSNNNKSVEDAGFYNGWTGGYFSATPPIVGSTLTNQSASDEICKKYFGSNAQVAEHHMGLYLPAMNDKPITGTEWNWQNAQVGGWNAWGYLKGQLPCGKMWTWINDQQSNCGA